MSGFHANTLSRLPTIKSGTAPLKNITRFTYEFTSFLGWRVTLCRCQVHFTRYFSDKQYGGEQAALKAAIRMRNLVLERLRRYPNDPDRAFALCRNEEIPTCYPRGLRPCKTRMAV